MSEGPSNLREILNKSSIKLCMSQKAVNPLHIGREVAWLFRR
jgi:hypothetical protein